MAQCGPSGGRGTQWSWRCHGVRMSVPRPWTSRAGPVSRSSARLGRVGSRRGRFRSRWRLLRPHPPSDVYGPPLELCPSRRPIHKAPVSIAVVAAHIVDQKKRPQRTPRRYVPKENSCCPIRQDASNGCCFSESLRQTKMSLRTSRVVAHLQRRAAPA